MRRVVGGWKTASKAFECGSYVLYGKTPEQHQLIVNELNALAWEAMSMYVLQVRFE